MTDRRDQAIELFAPLGPRYDRLGALLSFGQDPRWRKAMVSHVPRDGGSVLDVATGTGLVAERLLAQGHRVTGLDQSPDMLAVARSRFGDRVELVEASATAIPFADASFDHLTFTYLLRYVDDPGRHARRARPGRPPGRDGREPRVLRSPRDLAAALGSLRRRRPPRARPHRVEGLVRRRPLPRPVDSRLLRAVAARAPARALARGGRHGRPGAAHERRRWRRDLGHEDVRPAFYALRQGGWRDYVTLLHAPYTAWHLSYVVVGGCLVAEVSWGRLGLTVLAFFLAMGIGAHALDELAGRPLQTAIPALGPRRARGRLGRRSVRDRARGGVQLQPLDPAADRDRRLSRARVQPGAVRRPLPLRPLVRGRVGRLPRRHGRRRLRRHRPGRDRDRRRVGHRPLARPATALDPGQAKPPRGRLRRPASSSSPAVAGRRSRGRRSSRRPRRR